VPPKPRRIYKHNRIVANLQRILSQIAYQPRKSPKAINMKWKTMIKEAAVIDEMLSFLIYQEM
jgi:hypothetical protein